MTDYIVAAVSGALLAIIVRILLEIKSNLRDIDCEVTDDYILMDTRKEGRKRND